MTIRVRRQFSLPAATCRRLLKALNADNTPAQRLPGPRALLSLPMLVAFGLFTSPARAIPAASMQLFRVDGQGVKPLPALTALLGSRTEAREPGSPTSLPAGPALQAETTIPVEAAAANATGSVARDGLVTSVTPMGTPPVASTVAVAAATATSMSPGTTTRPGSGNRSVLLAQDGTGLNTPQVLEVNPDGSIQTNPSGDPITSEFGGNQLTIDFKDPLPTDMQGPIRVRFINEDGTLGSLQQEIVNYTLQGDGKQIILRPGSSIPAGQNFVLEFPSTCGGGTCVYPGQPVGEPLYIGFNSPQTIAPFSTAVAGAVAGASFPVWAVVLGVVVVGFGVAAVSGAFASSDGGGATNNSSQ